jgi:hypothetical protein
MDPSQCLALTFVNLGTFLRQLDLMGTSVSGIRTENANRCPSKDGKLRFSPSSVRALRDFRFLSPMPILCCAFETNTDYLAYAAGNDWSRVRMPVDVLRSLNICDQGPINTQEECKVYIWKVPL